MQSSRWVRYQQSLWRERFAKQVKFWAEVERSKVWWIVGKSCDNENEVVNGWYILDNRTYWFLLIQKVKIKPQKKPWYNCAGNHTKFYFQIYRNVLAVFCSHFCQTSFSCLYTTQSYKHVHVSTRSSATAEIVRDARNGNSRSLKVIRCCANQRGIYDFLLALNSNLTTVLDITPSLHIHTPPLFQVELEKDGWE